MQLYCLSIAPDESAGEGEDHDEWFASLRAATKRRKELIDANPNLDDHRTGRDFLLEKITIARLPLRKLVLAILNRTGFVESRTTVLDWYARPPNRPDEEDEEEA